jgi:hypothetical protein
MTRTPNPSRTADEGLQTKDCRLTKDCGQKDETWDHEKPGNNVHQGRRS